MTTSRIDESESEAMLSLEMGLQEVPKEASNAIYKVQRRLRNVYSKAYEPQIVSIGPYHHGKDQCKEMEKEKLRCMQLLNRKHDIELKDYMSKIAGIAKEARNCYADDISHISAVDFIKILMLDGCFIIELTSRQSEINKARIFHSLWDLILFENQIPFFVLCELFDLIEGPDKHDELMKRVVYFCRRVFPREVQYTRGKDPKKVKHILDLVYTNWCPSPPPPPPTSSICISISISSSRSSSEPVLFIPTASWLKVANVKFEEKVYDIHSRSTILFAVEFNEDNGVMSMSPLAIKDITESWLRNLIAYEQNYHMHEHTPVTDYALVLNNLIKFSKDVQILSQYGIIQNYVSSNQAVVDIVNRLTDKIPYYSKSFKHVDTYHRIRTHYENSWRRVMAECHHAYFSRTWSYISFFAGLLLFLLTVTQIVTAALQVLQQFS